MDALIAPSRRKQQENGFFSTRARPSRAANIAEGEAKPSGLSHKHESEARQK
jgi:hypothetical protein